MERPNREFHFLDLKFPLGGLLTFYGIVLAVYGLITSEPPLSGSEWIYHRSSGINVNLIWGILLLFVGGGLLAFSLLKRRASS